MASLVTAIGLEKEYGSGQTKVLALQDVSFQIEKGEVTVIVGPSGAGKTTLLNLLGGMDVPTKGVLAVDGDNVAAYSKKQRAIYRRDKIGFVFQFYNLDPNLTAKENVDLATELVSSGALNSEEVLNSVGLANRTTHRPYELSGGEQQRVSIARAIAKNPSIILCDEPTGALDYATGIGVLSLLADAARTYGKAVVIVTHNNAIKEMADHLIVLKNGKVISDERNPAPKRIEEIDW